MKKIELEIIHKNPFIASEKRKNDDPSADKVVVVCLDIFPTASYI